MLSFQRPGPRTPWQQLLLALEDRPILPPGQTSPQGNGLRAFLLQRFSSIFSPPGLVNSGACFQFRIKKMKGSRGHMAPMATPQEAPKEDSPPPHQSTGRGAKGGASGRKAPQRPPLSHAAHRGPAPASERPASSPRPRPTFLATRGTLFP